MHLPWTIVVLLVGGIAGCGGPDVAQLAAPGELGSDAYWALTLQDKAINLSVAPPTNTVQLAAVARNPVGAGLAGVTVTPTYTVLDPEGHLTVSPTGVLTAHSVGSLLPVVATWQYGTLTHTDTAYVTVTATAPASPLETFSIQPAPGDSAKWSYSLFDLFGSPKMITPVMTDAAGQPMTGLAVAYASSARYVAGVLPSGALQPVDPGHTVIRASTYAYGVRKADSVTYVIGYPTFQWISLRPQLAAAGGAATVSPATVTIGVGGVIVWSNGTADSIAITFADPAAATPAFPGGDGGDIAALPANSWAFRRFSTPGEYPYYDATGHLLGTIRVRSD